ncbi:MAG: NAD-dependent protein deacetylase [Nannocystaceae bacterium]|nr:NAD-dependent protein deacetylase [Nannocystaceae bacterium]
MQPSDAALAARAHAGADALALALRGRTIAVLTGAGISTESGIPDYRGPGTTARARNPIRFAEYAASESGRARYWARAMVGWPRFCAAEPNAGHHALAQLQRRGCTGAPITQNVDALHQAAGSTDVIELHGTLHRVRCLDCGALESRHDVQARLVAHNPALEHARRFDPEAREVRPDGDVELPARLLADFVVAACLRCGGTLKPDVVFFGESVPAEVVADAYARVEAAEALLVVGSSLAVFSGYRFVRRAHELGRTVAIVNLGPGRGDAYASVRVDAPAGAVLTALAERL